MSASENDHAVSASRARLLAAPTAGAGKKTKPSTIAAHSLNTNWVLKIRCVKHLHEQNILSPAVVLQVSLTLQIRLGIPSGPHPSFQNLKV